jgi:pimeloyl-ACP methyl ester carboxylesterase
MPRGLRTTLCLILLSAGLLGVGHPAAAAPELGWSAVELNVQRVKAAGTTFAWAELGTGSPLLLLNGTASPMSEWDPAFLAGLASANRVIVFDYPGLGDSGSAPASWTFEHAADWIADFAARVSPDEQVNVLGWSMGGFIAQQLAIRHPALIHNLVLAATNPGGTKTVLGPTWVQEIDSSSSSDADYLRTNYPPAGRAAGKRFLQRLSDAYDSGAYPVTETPERTLKAMVAAEDPWLLSNENLRQLSSVTAPTLVIDGKRDLITPPINSSLIASRIPHASLRVFSGAGHSFLFQLPAEISMYVNKFFSQRA